MRGKPHHHRLRRRRPLDDFWTTTTTRSAERDFINDCLCFIIVSTIISYLITFLPPFYKSHHPYIMKNNNNNNNEPFSVISYFAGKTIFLTGGTGLLGKQIVEKLLHCTDVAKIYILMRSKRDKAIIDREKEYIRNQVFQFRLTDTVMNKISIIPGDISMDGLGMSKEDRHKLTSECHVMIHSAATVRFDEPLSIAMNLNVCGTQRMLDLASECHHLESFVYVSTAFTHCYNGILDEVVTQPTIDPHSLLQMMKDQDEETFNHITAKKVIGPHPNTYTLTKSLSDFLVQERSMKGKIPLAIAKPAIITGPISEPYPGYCDELTQAIPAVGTGIGMGITRVIPGHKDHQLPIIPVDVVANSIIMIAAKTAADGTSEDFKAKSYGIFNTGDNIMSQGAAFGSAYEFSVRYPLLKSMRPPARVILTTSLSLYKVLIFFYEIMFIHLLDTWLRVTGDQLKTSGSKGQVRVNVKRIQSKAHKNILLLSFFLLSDWKVIGINNRTTFDSLSPKEKRILSIDAIDNIDWHQYIGDYYQGVRKYVFHESDDETTEKARQRFDYMRIRYNFVLGIVFAAASCLIFSAASFFVF